MASIHTKREVIHTLTLSQSELAILAVVLGEHNTHSVDSLFETYPNVYPDPPLGESLIPLYEMLYNAYKAASR